MTTTSRLISRGRSFGTDSLLKRPGGRRKTARKRCPATLVVAGLLLTLAMPVLAQGRGNGNGKPGGGGGSAETPLIIVFRDAPGDLLTSDGVGDPPHAYIAGDEGIARAAFDDAGEVRLSFVQSKGKNPTSGRHLVVDLTDDPEVGPPTPGWGPKPPKFGSEAEINAFFHISADGDGVNVRDLLAGQPGTDARFPIFSERKSDWEGWKLSFSDNILSDQSPSLDSRVTVTCVSQPASNCVAWLVEKENGKEPLAALVGGGTNEAPDAGIWSVPFGIAVCLKDEFDMYGPSAAFQCRMTVFGSP